MKGVAAMNLPGLATPIAEFCFIESVNVHGWLQYWRRRLAFMALSFTELTADERGGIVNCIV